MLELLRLEKQISILQAQNAILEALRKNNTPKLLEAVQDLNTIKSYYNNFNI